MQKTKKKRKLDETKLRSKNNSMDDGDCFFIFTAVFAFVVSIFGKRDHYRKQIVIKTCCGTEQTLYIRKNFYVMMQLLFVLIKSKITFIQTFLQYMNQKEINFFCLWFCLPNVTKNIVVSIGIHTFYFTTIFFENCSHSLTFSNGGMVNV